MDDAVESYLTELARTEHEEPVLVEMEARAANSPREPSALAA